MRAFILAVTGLAIGVAACGSYGTSVVEAGKTAQVASVAITLPSPSLVAGQTQRARVTLKDASGVALSDRAILWYTSAASVAAVTDSGVILGVAPGAATVSAVSEGVSGQAPLTVIPRPPVPVATVVVAINPAAVVVGQTAHATASVQDSGGNPLTDRAVTWQSGNPNVATVSSNGDISAVAPGTATISAASEGKTASASLSVSAPAPIAVASVSVSPASGSLLVGASVQLSAITRDANNNVLTGRSVSWTSDNIGIATVSGSGLVRGVAAGSVLITASSEARSGSAAFTVSVPAPVAVASVSVSPPTASLVVGGTLQLSAVTRDANNNVLTGRSITWSSDNSSVSTVSATGLVTVLAVGGATITATSETITGTSVITGTAPAPPPPPPGGAPVWRGNEPAGMTVVDDRPFNSMTESKLYWFGGGSITSDPTAPQSAPNVLHGVYRAGMAGGSAAFGTGVEGQGISNRTMYVCWWAKYSSNWYGHLSGVNKHTYFGANGSVGPVYWMARGAGTGALIPTIVVQSSLPTDGVYSPSSGTVPRGEWFYVEVLLTGNTAGNADGSVTWFLNGVRVGSKSGLMFTPADTHWDRIVLDPVWGGVGQTVPADMTLDFDHIYISGKN